MAVGQQIDLGSGMFVSLIGAALIRDRRWDYFDRRKDAEVRPTGTDRGLAGHRLLAVTAPCERFEQLTCPLITSGTILPHAHHEARTPIFATRDEHQNN